MVRIVLFVFFSVLPILLRAQNTWQYWNEAEIKYPFSQPFTVGFASEQRITNNIKTFALYNYGLAVHYKFNNHFKIKVNYLYEREKEIEWHTENRIEIVPVISFNTKKEFIFSIFPRFEYRIFKEESYWRWRQKFDIRKPILISKKKFTPYLSNEFFYSFNTNTLNQNWFTAGINTPINATITIEFYYRLMSKKSLGNWKYNNVMGTTFSYSLNHKLKQK